MNKTIETITRHLKGFKKASEKAQMIVICPNKLCRRESHVKDIFDNSVNIDKDFISGKVFQLKCPHCQEGMTITFTLNDS